MKPERGWDAQHTRYKCADDTAVPVRREMIRPSTLAQRLKQLPADERPELKSASRNEILHRAGALASGLLLSRDMERLVGVLDEVRIVAFPRSVRSVPAGVLKNAQCTRAVVVNDGIRALSGEFWAGSKNVWQALGVFQESDIASARLPASLLRLGASTFQHCWKLAHVTLPEGL